MKYIPSIYQIIKECVGIAENANTEMLIEAKKKKKKESNTKRVNLKSGGFKNLLRKVAEHFKSLGKPETISVMKIAEINNKKKMPVLMKHCVVAVQPKLKSQGKVESFIGAHNICAWSLQRHNLITKDLKLKGRGNLREKYHRSSEDEGASQKTAKYNKLFNSIFVGKSKKKK